MRILIACEESQRVCMAFRKKGHEAYSCDMIPCSGGHPECHIQQDVLSVLNANMKFRLHDKSEHSIIKFHTCDGLLHVVKKWDMIIAHPPCTYLTVSGNRWFNVERYGQKALDRIREREKAAQFFMQFVNCDCDKVCIENPIGYMSTHYRKADQIIQPWQFGHPYTKQTCLWLKGLNPLIPTKILQRPKDGWANQSFTPDGRYGGFNNKFRTAKERSKTFQGIADAMADQWG